MNAFQVFVLALFFTLLPEVRGQTQELPPCGQTCVNNMLALAPSLGCSPTDAACICKNANFVYGVRDCSNAACGADIASTVIAFASSYCSSALSTTASGGTAAATSTQSIVTTIADDSVASGSSSPSGSSSISTSASIPNQTPTTLSPSSVSSTLPSTLTKGSSISSTTPQPSSTVQSLSTGAKVGISIGAVIGALILGVLVYIAILLRRQRHTLPAHSRASDRLAELGPGLTPEMDGRPRPTELPAAVEKTRPKKEGDDRKWVKGRRNELEG